MTYLIFKSLHFIFIVTWFSGLFYLVRLFIYHVEAFKEKEPKRNILCSQYLLMEDRLWKIITIPSMFGVLFSGVGLLILVSAYQQSWFHLKSLFLLLLFSYHFFCGVIKKKLAKQIIVMSSLKLRYYNEVASFLLFGIVFIASLKSLTLFFKVSIFLVLFFILLFSFVSWYKKIREKNIRQ